MTSAPEQATRYDKLLDRAHEFISNHGGAVHEDLLVRHVFGSTSSPDLWRPLLRQILGESDVLGLRGDGYWTISSGTGDDEANHSLLSRAFTVIDVETTGLKPLQHRMIEFGAVRYRDGVQSGTLSVLIHPERRIPSYISKLTGIDDDLLTDAPVFADVAEQILEFIGDDPVIGYNVGFDVSFLNRELERCDRPSILNHAIDLLPVARSLMPGSRARGLGSLARELNVPATGAHRALNDALSTAGVLQALVPRLRAAGVSTLDQLDGFRAVGRVEADHSGPHARGRSLLDPRYVADAPSTPGVYIMRAANDRVIYVGKAKDLRARIRSYYSQPLGYTRKMDGLIQSIESIETVETGSELAALLLEAQLISRYHPQFNRQMRSSENYPYIRIETNNLWPRIGLVKEAAEDGARYFGPYRSTQAARATVEALNDIYPVRSCSRSFKDARSYGSPCTDLDFGRCLGPCTGLADREAYIGYIREAIAFLEGDVEPVMQRLHKHLEETAAKLDFERATRIRKRIERVMSLSQAQSVLTGAVNDGKLLIVLPGVEPDTREVLMTYHGRQWAKRSINSGDDLADVTAGLQRSWERAQTLASPLVLQQELDSVQILTRWVRKNWGHPSIIELDSPQPDWASIIAHALSVETVA